MIKLVPIAAFLCGYFAGCSNTSADNSSALRRARGAEEMLVEADSLGSIAFMPSAEGVPPSVVVTCSTRSYTAQRDGRFVVQALRWTRAVPQEEMLGHVLHAVCTSEENLTSILSNFETEKIYHFRESAVETSEERIKVEGALPAPTAAPVAGGVRELAFDETAFLKLKNSSSGAVYFRASFALSSEAAELLGGDMSDVLRNPNVIAVSSDGKLPDKIVALNP